MNRDKKAQVYLTDEEKEKIKQKAEEQGVSISSYLRLKGLDKL